MIQQIKTEVAMHEHQLLENGYLKKIKWTHVPHTQFHLWILAIWLLGIDYYMPGHATPSCLYVCSSATKKNGPGGRANVLLQKCQYFYGT